MRPSTLERLTWVLIYSGLLIGCLGVFLMRRDSALGWGVATAGAIDAATGAVLIWVRSRRPSGNS